jgi:hypothetical protein
MVKKHPKKPQHSKQLHKTKNTYSEKQKHYYAFGFLIGEY